jgi:hypothetical protein
MTAAVDVHIFYVSVRNYKIYPFSSAHIRCRRKYHDTEVTDMENLDDYAFYTQVNSKM